MRKLMLNDRFNAVQSVVTPTYLIDMNVQIFYKRALTVNMHKVCLPNKCAASDGYHRTSFTSNTTLTVLLKLESA